MNAGSKRMVHQTLWASGQFSRLSQGARLLYIGLITMGDDDGRLKGAAALVRSNIFPYDDDIKVADVTKWLSEIEAQKLVVRYEIDGEAYYFHPKWDDYQHIREDRRRDSHIPAPDIEFLPATTKRQPKDNQKGVKTPPNTSKDNISKDNINKDIAFAPFWEKYPKKVGKKAAWKSWQKLTWTPDLNTKIMRALAVAIASDQWTKDSGRYIPHATTWLNGERWEDEYKPPQVKNSKYDHVGTTTTNS